MKFLLMEWYEPFKFWWKLAAYFDTINQKYCYNLQFLIKKHIYNSKVSQQLY